MSSKRAGHLCGVPECKAKIKTSEDKLKCEKCNTKYHLSCSGFNAEAFSILKSENSLKEMIWFGTTCRQLVR